MSIDEVLAFVGIDWASEIHQACAIDASGSPLDERAIPHSGEGLADLCNWALELGGGDPGRVWIGTDRPNGPLVETLLERGFPVFALNPKQMDRFRDRFTLAGAKDDRLDGYVLADSLRTDSHCYKRIEVDEPTVIEMRQWSRMYDELGEERVRLSNRVKEELRRYYPQMLEIETDMSATWFLELLARIPTPDKACRTQKRTVAAILKRNRIRKLDARTVLQVLRQKPVVVAPGTTQAATSHVRLLTERLRVVNRQLKDCSRQLELLTDQLAHQLCDEEDEEGEKNEQHDVDILRSLPGIGQVVLAVLLSEAWPAIRNRDYHLLRALSGVAPVTRGSGKSRRVVMRKACNNRLRNALYHWARIAAQRDPKSKVQYMALRARGHSHGHACRTVGDRLLTVACAMLRDQTIYNPALRQGSRDQHAA